MDGYWNYWNYAKNIWKVIIGFWKNWNDSDIAIDIHKVVKGYWNDQNRKWLVYPIEQNPQFSHWLKSKESILSLPQCWLKWKWYRHTNDLTLAFIDFLRDNIVLNGQPFRDRQTGGGLSLFYPNVFPCSIYRYPLLEEQ